MYLTLANLTLDIPDDVTLEELTAVCTMLSARQAELSYRRALYPPDLLAESARCEREMFARALDAAGADTFTQTHKGGR